MLNNLKKKYFFSIICSIVIISCVVFLVSGQNSLPQAQTLSLSSADKSDEQTHKIRSGEVSKTAASSDSVFAQASSRNAELKHNLSWTFGGKSQRGWQLYESLINQLINSDADADSVEFAAALSRWQQTAALPQNGILDETSLATVIKTWQSRRLKVKGYPSPDELVMAPASDFWDSSRPEELRQVERETYAAYKRMVAAAAADKSLKLAANSDGSLATTERYLKIVSSFRSREYQEKLRQASPNSGRAGLAVNSPHFTGRALDIYVGGEPVSTADANRAVQVNTPVYQWLVKNAHKFGFKPYFYEPWHWEYAPDE